MTPEKRKILYFEMLRIRRVEEAVADHYGEKQMKCPVHLSIGQEAVPVGICAQLSVQDRVYSTHRCHAHYLAKGGGIREMIAELHGKVTGCCKGKGGSMHLVDYKSGMMGSSALVGGTIPLAVGSALTFAFEKKPLVSVAFFGDGATEEGIFYESMNFAALKKLPVIFAVENNLYATYSHQKSRQAGPIFKRGEMFSIPSQEIDGNDVQRVYESTQVAIQRARAGGGPTLLEFSTYRWRDHVGPAYDFEIGYRTKAEVENWMAYCPIENLKTALLNEKQATLADLEEYEYTLKQEIDSAFTFAKESAFPNPSEIYTEIYAQD
jgi:TPP-dependent pyruvate/acetoin dehydrogenase alpha subunit